MSAVEWRPVVGLEGRYEVSSDGEVRSLPRYVLVRGGGMRLVKPRIMTQCTYKGRGSNRVCVTLSHGTKGDQMPQRVCWVVASAFLGAVKGDKVRRLDGDAWNNRVVNLVVLKAETASQEGVAIH